MEDKFNKQLKKLDIYLSEKQKWQFKKYYELLTEWNKVMNLTGIIDYDEVNEKHFVDSLAIVKSIELKKVNEMIDIGTGAGFPGIPLKIVFPQMHVVLLDSLNKRVKFLNMVIEEIGLQNIDTLHGRAEDYARQEKYRERFDLCVSRAVANLSTLCEYCIPYLRIGGIFISYKSGNIEEELRNSSRAIKVLGGEVEKNIIFQLPETDISRSFIKIKKRESTKKEYPRKAGIPAKEPM
ncbi:16S rRNA (guanine(527)-N(7))-methyltransferase RsmG [Muricomes intestini]|jgi:16S rRNA (guanine527-N7)-methyltransferase|uniref:Ribosomal RNA small subunit methyltransferase G n=1 Tax=Muricomes intestini TaxID=1796634 RepID=A0A4R3K9D2_9FIRM|nr:16S rRNA (guanine(527)-N(7))-methyltransferase RsmG [Muricomes intestini]TCS79528.1 16S rRNA m(7)G-527 methyltransferase [Muricomes intestini]